jgi:hypothetical protein
VDDGSLADHTQFKQSSDTRGHDCAKPGATGSPTVGWRIMGQASQHSQALSLGRRPLTGSARRTSPDASARGSGLVTGRLPIGVLGPPLPVRDELQTGRARSSALSAWHHYPRSAARVHMAHLPQPRPDQRYLHPGPRPRGPEFAAERNATNPQVDVHRGSRGTPRCGRQQRLPERHTSLSPWWCWLSSLFQRRLDGVDAGCFVHRKDLAQRARRRNIQVHPSGVLDLLFEPQVECIA